MLKRGRSSPVPPDAALKSFAEIASGDPVFELIPGWLFQHGIFQLFSFPFRSGAQELHNDGVRLSRF